VFFSGGMDKCSEQRNCCLLIPKSELAPAEWDDHLSITYRLDYVHQDTILQLLRFYDLNCSLMNWRFLVLGGQPFFLGGGVVGL